MDYQKLLAALFAVLFVVFALVQHNDPDAQIWISIYSAAALASFLAALDRLPTRLYGWLGMVALGGAALLSPKLLAEIERVRTAQEGVTNPLMRSATSMEYEVVKEMGGLLIIALAFVVLYVLKRRRAADAPVA